MYNFSDTGSGAISVIFFVAVVLIGAFFTMNLVLAIIVDQFAASREAAAELILAKEEAAKEAAGDADADADAEDEELEKDSKDSKINKGSDDVNKEINLGDTLVKKPGDNRIEKQINDEISNIEKKD